LVLGAFSPDHIALQGFPSTHRIALVIVTDAPVRSISANSALSSALASVLVTDFTHQD
jgi:hypothetical protein